jgi:hypothetical protein
MLSEFAYNGQDATVLVTPSRPNDADGGRTAMPDAHRNPPRRGRGNESPIHLNQAQVVRFWTHVRKDGASGCWVWASYRTRSGYGRFSVGDIDLRAHRVSWILVRGQLNPGDTLDHLCRNRACVNPDHLEVVDHRTNIMRG